MLLAEESREFSTSVVVTFEERNGKTLLTIVQSGFERRAGRDGIEGGWPSILDALQNVVTDEAAS